MGLTLSVPPGFSDLANAALVANQPAFAINAAKIYSNSAFAMVNTEFFVTMHAPGDTVPIPVSPIDGYKYSREELIYVWHIERTTNAGTGWMTAKDSLWYAAWLVDQTTGKVYCDEWYRRSGNHYDGVHTNDGVLRVFTIAQRQRTHLIIASSPTYSAISPSVVAQDKPFTQALAQALNDNAKFAALNKEVFYLGEYYNGQTVVLPHSPADGHAYSAGECKFVFSWRWTADHSVFAEPPVSYGQMHMIKASVNSSGVVSCSVAYSPNTNPPTTYTTYGRIAVFAFCQRNGTPGSISPAATSFAELDFDFFMPGQPLPFDVVVQQIIKNIEESLLTPEYFGPTSYGDGATVALPTSPVDGYAYSRAELSYIYDWSDTTPHTGPDTRQPVFYGKVDPTTGVIDLHVHRLPPNGPIVDDDNSLARLSVITVARRRAQLAAITDTTTGFTQSSGFSTDPADVPTVSSIVGSAVTGAINSSNQAFTITASATILFVVWNGQVRFDFSQSSPPSNAFTTSFTPDTGDTLYAVYTT